MVGRIALVLVCSLSVTAAAGIALAPPARAQEAPQEAPPDDAAAKKEAAKFLKAGDILIKQGDSYRKRKHDDKATEKYTRALEAYQRAFDVYPKPELYWLIGLAEQRLGRYLDALRHYQQLLREAKNINDDLHGQIELNIEESKQHVATLRFAAQPEGARISVDGEDVGTAPYTDPVYLAPGEHTLAVTAEGYTPDEETVTLDEGTESERTFALEKIPVVVTKEQPLALKPPPPPPVDRRMLIIGASATAALAVTATVTGLIAVAKHGTFTDDSLSQSKRDKAASSGKKYALVTDIMWIGAIGAGAFTAYQYYGVYRPEARARERRMRQARRLQIIPELGPGTAGVAVTGSF